MWTALELWIGGSFALALLCRIKMAGGCRAWGRLVGNRLRKLWLTLLGWDVGERGDLSEGR